MSRLCLRSPSGDSRRAFLMAFLERVGVVVLLEGEALWIGDVAERVEREWLLMEKEDTLLNRPIATKRI